MNQGTPKEGIVTEIKWPPDIKLRIEEYLEANPNCGIIMIDSLGQLSSPTRGEVTGKSPELLIVDEVRLPPAGISDDWIREVITLRMRDEVAPVVMKKPIQQDPWRRQGKRKGQPRR